MATFTMELSDVMRITDDIGLNAYPIFDESYREGLNKKIKDHFFHREIGQETPDLFIFALRRKMNEIMPLYNQRYKSQALEIDPLLTFRSTSHTASSGTSSTETDGTTSAENSSTSDGKGRNVHSDFPQTQLSENGDYASAADDSVSHSEASGTAGSTENSTSTGNQTATGDTTSEGFSASMSELLLRFRDTFINIDMEIIEELESLFMGIWTNGDEFSEPYGYGAFYGGYSPYPW